MGKPVLPHKREGELQINDIEQVWSRAGFCSREAAELANNGAVANYGLGNTLIPTASTPRLRSHLPRKGLLTQSPDSSGNPKP